MNRGDFTHRIQIKTRDQMASLEQSFNSMTGSLVKLLAEQKEKQRLESELAIGHEVQNSLFPRNFTGLGSLEVYGVCRPARSVQLLAEITTISFRWARTVWCWRWAILVGKEFRRLC